eukprot:3180646-Pleurochrysis_carterae.AAC.2
MHADADAPWLMRKQGAHPRHRGLRHAPPMPTTTTLPCYASTTYPNPPYADPSNASEQPRDSSPSPASRQTRRLSFGKASPALLACVRVRAPCSTGGAPP